MTNIPTWKARDYQCVALSFLLSTSNGALFLDAGLGKTASVLSLIDILKNANEKTNQAVLIVAPLRVAHSTWPNEIEKWSNFESISHTVLHGKQGKQTLFGDQKDVYLINPEGLAWLYEQLVEQMTAGKPCPFSHLIVDESTRFANPKIKDRKSKKLTRFGRLCQLLPLFERTYIMTGTPCANNYLQLWSQIYLLDKGAALGSSFYKFRAKYFYSEVWAKYEFKLRTGAPAKIQQAIAHLVLDMSTEGNVKLPDVVYNYIPIYFTKKLRGEYNRMQSEMFARIDEFETTAKSAVEARLKCRQMCNGSLYEDLPEVGTDEELALAKRNRKTFVIHTLKIDALEGLVNELNGKPILIAYDFQHDLAALLKLFGKDTPYIGSGVSGEKGKQIEKDWNAGNIPVLLGHPRSMGHGLNMQAAGNDICWFSIPESLELYIQFNKRIHRSGVVGTVRIHHLVMSDTLDEMLISRLDDKADVQEDLRVSIRKYRKLLND